MKRLLLKFLKLIVLCIAIPALIVAVPIFYLVVFLSSIEERINMKLNNEKIHIPTKRV